MTKTRNYKEWKKYLEEMAALDRGHDCSNHYEMALQEFKKEAPEYYEIWEETQERENARLARNLTMFTDAYELFMSDVYVKEKKNTEGVFDVFFRGVPNEGGYAVMAGLDKVIKYIQNLKITEADLEDLKKYNFTPEFIEYMRNFKFTGDIYAVPDGTPVFPNEPILTVKAPLIQAQIIETAVLSFINGAMEHATGARRIVEATPKNVPIMEFGARRADGPEAGIDASIYAMMAGCAGTSNVIAARMLGIKALGTMAHSFVEKYDTELEAFIAFATTHPGNATLLVDTYNTLKSGVPNAIKTFKYMKEHGYPVDHIGIRIDSGDLEWLCKEARRMLDEAGFPQAKICISNALDDKKIKALIDAGTPFDSIGAGDNISKPNGRMGNVYKLVAIIQNGLIIPKIKVSEDPIKTVNPDFKELYRAYNKETGYAIGDIICSRGQEIPEDKLKVICLKDYNKTTTLQNYRLEKLQKPIFVNGQLVYKDPTLLEKKAYCEAQMQTIYTQIKRIVDPVEYYVDGTEEYVNLKEDMKEKIRILAA